MDNKFLILIIGLLGTVLMFSGCVSNSEAQSTEDLSWKNVEESGVLKVGLCAAWPPFESRNEKTGEIEGFDVDLANALGEELGVKVEIIDADWQALFGGLSKGDYDTLITCMSKKEAYAESVEMSDVYYELNDVIVVKKDNTEINSVSDLSGKTVGVQLATGSEQAVDSLSGLGEIKRYNYNNEAFIDLQNNRVDAVVVGYTYALVQMSEYPDLKVLDEPVSSSDIVMVQKGGALELTVKLNEALLKIKENGKYDEIREKWLSLE
ncbi:ABC transporter substrate-binding protein [Methanococcus sp. CF]